jgi:ribosome-associated protein
MRSSNGALGRLLCLAGLLHVTLCFLPQQLAGGGGGGGGAAGMRRKAAPCWSPSSLHAQQRSRGSSNPKPPNPRPPRQPRQDGPMPKAPVPEEQYEIEPLSEDSYVNEVYTACSAADMRKAGNIRALRVAGLTTTADYLIIVEGNSRPQNQAIAAAIMDDMEEKHGRTAMQQGTPDSGWILLDYGHIICVRCPPQYCHATGMGPFACLDFTSHTSILSLSPQHVMTPRSRAYYDLEGFWKNGVDVDLSHCLAPDSIPASVRVRLELEEGEEDYGVLEEEEEDPFWT